jgi:hypothetical protein
MKRIKFTSKTTLKLTNQHGYPIKYKGYMVGSLPPRFAFLYDKDKESEGISKWFNYKGLTWIIAPKKIF